MSTKERITAALAALQMAMDKNDMTAADIAYEQWVLACVDAANGIL